MRRENAIGSEETGKGAELHVQCVRRSISLGDGCIAGDVVSTRQKRIPSRTHGGGGMESSLYAFALRHVVNFTGVERGVGDAGGGRVQK